MKIVAIPVLIVSGLSFYTGFYHLIVYSRQRDDKKQLTFGLMCLAVGLYDIFSAGVYNANSVIEASPWQRGQVATMMLSGAAMVWFVSDYTTQKPKKLLTAFTVYFLTSALVHIFIHSDLVWKSLDHPSIKDILLFNRFEITYYEMTPGLFTDLNSLMSLFIFGFIFWMAIRYYRSGDRRKATPLLISLSLFWVGIFNDTLVSSGVYNSIYLMEYTFLAIVVLMAFTLSNQIAILAKELQGREERLRTTMISIDDLIFEISDSGEFENSPTTNLEHDHFFTTKKVVGKPFTEILPPELSELISEKMAQLTSTNQVQQFDFSASISGNLKWYSAKMSIRREAAGNPAGVTIVARDITARKQAEENVIRLNEELEDRVLARTRELNEKNKELEAFSYSISHDLRAPLRAISGFSTILLDEHKQSLNTEGVNFLELIQAAGHKMNELIESLLALSRLSRQSINFQKADIFELANSAFRSLGQGTHQRNIEFNVQQDPAANAMVYCDPQLLEIILTNIFSNAIKFTKNQNPSVIEFGNQHVDDRSVFYVSDNGVGFAQTNAEKIFLPFQRIHSDEEFEGTGIGLAIVLRAIERLGGEIWVNSEIDQGTTFYFTLRES